MNRTDSSLGQRPQSFDRAALGRLYPALATLPPRQASELFGSLRPFRAAAGAEIFAEDSACPGLALLLRGTIRVSRGSPEGREILLYRVRPGELCILSVSCLLGGTSYPARASVEEDVEGGLLPPEFFETLVEHDPTFRRFVFGAFRNRITDLMVLVEEVAFRRLDQRLAALLLSRQRERDQADLVCTHQDLADQLGSVREMASRVLESFADRGAIKLARGRLTILRPELLQEIAGIDHNRETTNRDAVS